MKKRDEQKLIVISLVLFVLLNVPFISVFDYQGHILGFPVLYFFIFLCWILVVVISYKILSKYDE